MKMRVLLLTLALGVSACATAGGLLDEVADLEFHPYVSPFSDEPARELRGAQYGQAPCGFVGPGDEAWEMLVQTSRVEGRRGRARGISEQDRIQLREWKLRRQIDAGRFDCLPAYWEGIFDQPAIGLTYFTIRYAVPATRYVADRESDTRLGAWAQAQTAAYFSRGCSTSRMSRYAPRDNFGCRPRADLAQHYQALLEANPARARNEPF